MVREWTSLNPILLSERPQDNDFPVEISRVLGFLKMARSPPKFRQIRHIRHFN